MLKNRFLILFTGGDNDKFRQRNNRFEMRIMFSIFSSSLPAVISSLGFLVEGHPLGHHPVLVVLVEGEHVVAFESHLDSLHALHPAQGKGGVGDLSGGAVGVLSDSPVHVVDVNVSETHDAHHNHVSP